MKFKLDENLPQDLTELLSNAGYDALTVTDQGFGGAPDSDVIAVCQQEKRTLITLDVDFANLAAYPPADAFGIIVLRLNRQDKMHVFSVVEALLPTLGREVVDGALWIVDERRVRIRR